ncbi:MAG TPA: hypothetical protein DCY07_01460 [Rhodospirillaceae bacterium]|nr:hypothetical protein [Rhodospirillaceae bacterium]
MENAFAAAMDDLFADPNIAANAVYLPSSGGAGSDVRVILKRPDEVASFGEARIASETLTLQVRVVEIQDPEEDDMFLINGRNYVVQGEPIADALRLIWTLNTRPA